MSRPQLKRDPLGCHTESMIARVILLTLLLALSIPDAGAAQRSSAGPGAFNRDSTSCAVPSDPSAESRAIACAEGFIAVQDYTWAPASVDSSSIVYEFMELEPTWRKVLAARRGELRLRAVGVCDDGNWVEVIFVPATDSAGRYGKAVRVRKDFQFVNVVHQLFRLPALSEGVRGCHKL